MGLGGSGRRSLGSSAQPKQVHRTCMKALALGISHRLSFSPHSDTVHKHFPYRKCTPGPKSGGCGGLNGAASAGSRCWPGRTRVLAEADALRKPHWRRWHQGLARGFLCADGLRCGLPVSSFGLYGFFCGKRASPCSACCWRRGRVERGPGQRAAATCEAQRLEGVQQLHHRCRAPGIVSICNL